jgi:hypothetical protein
LREDPAHPGEGRSSITCQGPARVKTGLLRF